MNRFRVSLQSALQLASGAILTAPALLTSCTTEVEPATRAEAEFAATEQAVAPLPGFVTSSKPYVVSITPEYAVQALLSVGDRVPRTSNPGAQQYQFIGIPDGMGAYRENGVTSLYVNHELLQASLSEPIVGQPLNRGAIVSLLKLDSEGRVTSGDRAYNTIFNENTLVGPAADVSNTTGAFVRFCSGSLASREAGFDRPIYFAGEESSGAATYDGRGGLAVAIFDGELHTMPKFGRFPWENTLAQPKRSGDRTVLIGMEDGPASPDNQLYMYVGKRERTRNATPMRRNGLDNGKMYAFVSTTPGITTEPQFLSGSIEGYWAELPGAEALTDVDLELLADSLGAFGFIRTEDGAFDPDNPNVYYFVATGDGTGNRLGRLYRMTLDDSDPTGHTTIDLIYNADDIIAAGGDIAISPDNIDVSSDYIMINEDGTGSSRAVMAQKGRDGSVWRLDKHNGYAATRVGELFPPGRDANFGVTSGIWETTGVLSVKGFGNDAWLLNVQAHAPTVAPAANVVEDGQLVLLRRTHIDQLFSE